MKISLFILVAICLIPLLVVAQDPVASDPNAPPLPIQAEKNGDEAVGPIESTPDSPPVPIDVPEEQQTPATTLAPADKSLPATTAEPEQKVEPVREPAPVTAPAPAASVEAKPVVSAPKSEKPRGDSLVFNFTGASWKDVLEWFSEQADLSLQIDRFPAGSVNYVDPSRTYSVSEGLDILNRLLLDRGYALVRRGRMLLLIDLEVENAANLISEVAELVSLDELDDRSRSDIVSCVFPLGSLKPDAARQEIAQLVGPWGRTIVLDSARQVKVTETVGKLLAIRQLLDNAKQAESNVVEIVLKNRGADEMLELARPLIGLESGTNANDEIRISVGVYGDRIYATGLPGKVSLLESIIEKADKPLIAEGDNATATVVAPVFETHRVTQADSATVFDVLQTLLAGTPDARIAIDPKTNALVCYARPETQQLIAQTIAKLEGNGQEFKVISLRSLDPAQALVTINKFFGITETGGNGPIIDGDPVTNRLWIRGTAEEIATVEKLISELEGTDALGTLGDNVRILPYTGQAAQDALQQVQSVWSTLGRTNEIRTIRTGDGSGSGIQMPDRHVHPPKNSKDETAPKASPETNDSGQPMEIKSRSPQPSPFEDRTGVMFNQTQTQLVGAPVDELSVGDQSSASDSTLKLNIGGSDIVIQFSPAGMIVASEDTEALDAFESLMQTFASSSAVQSDLPTIFWLKYAKADVTAELISTILGGGASSLDSMADSMSSSLGGLGGGMLGLLGMGGGGGEESSAKSVLTSTGSVTITPDARLNALIVQANPFDLETIEIILRKIDIQESPEEVLIVAKPALIPVIHQDAKSIAEVVKSVFAEKMKSATENKGGGGGQPNPQEIIAALRGGGGRGGRGGGESTASEPAKISVAVDERSNSLIVTATPQDFELVRQLVVALDEGGMQSEEKVEVVTLKGNIKADIVKQALESILGTAAKTATTTGDGKAAPSPPSASSSSNSSSGGTSADELQRRIDFFRSLRGDSGGGRGGDSGGRSGAPGGSSGGPFGGGGGRGR